jgi:O-antigen biosynthesis protein WbqV
MAWFPKVTSRKLLIMGHDVLATAAAIVVALYVRFDEVGLAERWPWLRILLLCFVTYAAVIYRAFRLYDAKWRFASLPDLFNIFRASTVLAISLLVLDYILVSAQFYGGYFFGKVTIAVYWWLQMFFLGGPRIAYRYFRYTRTRREIVGAGATPTLVLGRAADAEVLLRGTESGAVKNIRPIGILSPSAADQDTVIRNIPVLGTIDDLERTVAVLASRGKNVARLVLMPTAMLPEAKPETVLMRARQLGLIASRLPAIESAVDPGGQAVRLAPIAVEDLLLRPSVKIDYQRLEKFVRGKSVAVTGGGGSIGAEICDRVIAFGAERLLILENSEPALHAVLEALATKGSPAIIEGRLADIRDRQRVFQLFQDFRPDLVFHAAALKHVPLLEHDWSEGVKTNVFGSVNVADAAIAANARAMVMISTDKAIEPISVLGATKRFAEMYCQSLDADRLGSGHGVPGTRLIAVRFGNVLASNGSVVPKFKAQIEAGGPITVTDPEMVRYFMTIREACDLVITSASHALGRERSDASVYVLNMGQPIKILDLAHRMIQLSGLEPNRDIEIVYTGIRPGERLNEILFAREEPTSEIGIAGIVAAKPLCPSLEALRKWMGLLEQGVREGQRSLIYSVIRQANPDFPDERVASGAAMRQAVGR